MSDTVEFGGWPRPPRWAWALAAAVTVAVLVTVINARTGPHRAAASPAGKPARPAASPVRGSPAPAVASSARWPSAAGACGMPAYLPRIRMAGRYTGTAVRLLAGGTGLWQITAGGTAARRVMLPPGRGLLVTKLVAGAGVDYAFVAPRCSGYLWVYRIAAGAARRLGTTADDLLGGPPHAWAVTYRRRTVLRPLNGGRKITLGPKTSPVAGTAAGLVVGAYDPRAPRPYSVELVSTGTGALLRRLAGGSALGAAGDVALVSQPGCGLSLARRTCTLEGIDVTTGRPTATFGLPPGRAPASGAVFGRGGAVAAFQLARATQDPRFRARSPYPPADVAVLDLRTGALDVVPGLELPPTTQTGLAFGPSGRWLFITVNEGDHGELLAWRHGMPGPALVTSLPGPLAVAPPLLAVPPARG